MNSRKLNEYVIISDQILGKGSYGTVILLCNI
jgi:hypothetical protein